MFRKIMLFCTVLLGPWLAFSGAAFAQAQQCAPYEVLASHLTDKYGEAVIWQGQASQVAVVQLWMNSETGTWTLVSLSVLAEACMLASGQGGETVTPPPCWHGGLSA